MFGDSIETKHLGFRCPIRCYKGQFVPAVVFFYSSSFGEIHQNRWVLHSFALRYCITKKKSKSLVTKVNLTFFGGDSREDKIVAL
jgi:hypothetical protein